MPRGGRRQPRAGASYPNRSDLAAGPRPQPIRTAPGQPYGAQTQQADAQRAIPLPQVSGGGRAPVSPPPPAAAAPSPGSFPPLDRATERPGEPLTHGSPFGPGGGPEVLGQNTDDQLRALYMLHPSDDLRALIEYRDTGGF